VLVTDQTDNKNHVNSWAVFKLTKLFSEVVFYKRTLLAIMKLILRLRREPKAKLYYLMPDRPVILRQRDKIFFEKICGIKCIIGFDSVVDRESIKDKYGKLTRQQPEFKQLFRSILPSSSLSKLEILPRPYLYPSEKDLNKIKKIMKLDTQECLTIALGPGSKMLGKKWPVERYSELVSHILKTSSNCRVAIFGAPNEQPESDYICDSNQSDRLISLVGSTNIIESAAALSLCAFYVGNDTGTMHLAAAMGLPCIGIFSSRANPGRWEPFGAQNIILRKDSDHAGCELLSCHLCLEGLKKISLGEVIDATTKMKKSLGFEN
jgi:heptosyltransferase III